MPKLSAFDSAALTEMLRKQHGVVSREQALACEMTPKAVAHRIRPGGPWQVALPGVYVTHAGSLTDKQRASAAFLHAGRALAITGPAAVSRYGVPCPASAFVDVLVPRECRRRDVGFVRLHPTGIVPASCFVEGPLRYASAPRAVADTVRQLTEISAVRALVAASVQRGKVAIWQLDDELRTGPRQGSATLRRVLAEVADGIRSAAEADLRTLLHRSRVPAPLYNPQLFVGKKFLASPDAWWPDFGVATEVDSKEWHTSPADWDRTLDRHARMTEQGILVLHFPPQRIRAEGWKVVRQIRSALDASRGPLPHILTVPVR
jgi:hypothetical protein